MNRSEPVRDQLDRVQRCAFLVGGVSLALCFVGFLLNRQQFFRSYLVAYLFWLGLALGCLAVVMLHHLVGGGWGFVIRRMLEAGTRTLPWMALLMVPLLFGMRELYSWTRAGAADEALRHKSVYLNVPFFLARAAIYFVAWNLIAYFLNRWSAEQDRTAESRMNRRLQGLSGPGLVVYGLTITFASVDWVMSLEPHWFSTIYGIIFMVGQALTALSFVVIVAMLLADREPLAGVISPAHFHDLGNLMFAFVMLWAYVSFSQFLITWSGNLPEEITWYMRRIRGGWAVLALALVVFHFALPFLLLLLRDVKRRMKTLAAIAVAMLFMRLLDLFWIIRPAFAGSGWPFYWTDVLAPVGIGGIWVALFLRELKGRPLLPLHDPRFEVIAEHA